MFNHGTAVDVNGHQYKGYDHFKKAYISDSHISNITTLMPDTPLEMRITFIPDSEIPYVKVLDVEAYNNHSFRFTNIPIKWE